MFITLKPVEERKVAPGAVINRLRRKLAEVGGINLFLKAVQYIRVGGRFGKAQFQYALQSSDLEELNYWSTVLVDKLRGLPPLDEQGKLPPLQDVNSDQQTRGLQATVVIDRDAAARLGVSSRDIDNTLYDAFGQRQVSTIYKRYNQHHVILQLDPKLLRGPSSLPTIYCKPSTA